jgi:hypothetical protein
MMPSSISGAKLKTMAQDQQYHTGVTAETGCGHCRVANHQGRVALGVLDRVSRFVRRDAHRRHRLAVVHFVAQSQHLGAGVVVIAEMAWSLLDAYPVQPC